MHEAVVAMCHSYPIGSYLNRWALLGHAKTGASVPDSMVKKGDFIEETMGIAQREDIRQNGALLGDVCATIHVSDYQRSVAFHPLSSTARKG